MTTGCARRDAKCFIPTTLPHNPMGQGLLAPPPSRGVTCPRSNPQNVKKRGFKPRIPLSLEWSSYPYKANFYTGIEELRANE